MHAWLYYIEGACDLLIGRPQLTGFTESEFNSLLLLHISQGYHTYNYSAHNIPDKNWSGEYNVNNGMREGRLIVTAHQEDDHEPSHRHKHTFPNTAHRKRAKHLITSNYDIWLQYRYR